MLIIFRWPSVKTDQLKVEVSFEFYSSNSASSFKDLLYLFSIITINKHYMLMIIIENTAE